MRALAEAWHRRVVAHDVVGHAFPHRVAPPPTQRLAADRGEALGGPPTFTTACGTGSDVVRRHSGNGDHPDMDDRAIACFDTALDDVGIGASPLRDTLHGYFAWATRTAMNAYPESPDDVPDGLEVARWSWDGLVAS